MHSGEDFVPDNEEYTGYYNGRKEIFPGFIKRCFGIETRDQWNKYRKEINKQVQVLFHERNTSGQLQRMKRGYRVKNHSSIQKIENSVSTSTCLSCYIPN